MIAPMTEVPHRQSLVTQLAGILRGEIAEQRWTSWLPEERELARTFQVSRSTLRAALAVLRREGRLETLHGLGTRVTAREAAPRAKHGKKLVAVLLPRALEHFRYFMTLVVDDLREQLFAHDCHLQLHEHPQVAARRPFHFLERLVAQNRCSSWLLIGCGGETQRWFSDHAVPAVVSGTCDPTLGLPFVSLDNHALGRHAAVTLLQHGHRSVGALLTHSNPALKTGLNEVFAKASEATLVAMESDDGAESVARAVDRLLALESVPSALFVAESNLYLSCFSRLTQRGLRIPEDISLLCRDDEPYLNSLLPKPARYSKNPHLYAKRLLQDLLKVIDSEPISHPASYLMPEFVPGGSLRKIGRPAASG